MFRKSTPSSPTTGRPPPILLCSSGTEEESTSQRSKEQRVSLESIHNLMRAAQQGRYAVGYFESWNLESLQGVLDAAEQTRSPIILGFNGDFLSQPARTLRER